MHNLQILEVLKGIKKEYPITNQQYEAISAAAEAVKLRVPKPPVHIREYCGTCRVEIKPGQKICENCGQWILWEDRT